MKKSKVVLYEGMYIFRAALNDLAKKQALTKALDLIQLLGGSTEKVIDWGRRKLAYAMKGSYEGHYYLLYFLLPSHQMDELIRENRLNEDLLRFMHVLSESVPDGDKITFKPLVEAEK